jgi:hypothetical protein
MLPEKPLRRIWNDWLQIAQQLDAVDTGMNLGIPKQGIHRPAVTSEGRPDTIRYTVSLQQSVI